MELRRLCYLYGHLYYMKDGSVGNFCLFKMRLAQHLLHIVACDVKCLHIHRGGLEHSVNHHGLHNGTQAARSQLVLHGLVHYQVQGFRLECKLHAVDLEHTPV